MDEQARSVPLLSVESAVQKMWYSKRRAVLAVVTDSLLLSQFSLGPEGVAQEMSKVTDQTSYVCPIRYQNTTTKIWFLSFNFILILVKSFSNSVVCFCI